ncbi:MAG: carboxypeptidase-like regulatory domain-containing protein [Bacteroidia bacterium]|nr:carboxypeptidase-like regulatory domain-containing protein [Bacteroidia bacterium]
MLHAVVWFLWASNVEGQQAIIYGTISDSKNTPVEFANIAVAGFPVATKTDSVGKYTLQIPADTVLKIVVTSIGFEKQIFTVKLTSGQSILRNFKLESTAIVLPAAQVTTDVRNDPTLQALSPKLLKSLANPSSNFESLLKSTMAVVSNNELSSDYSVRGGSFDENLVYVNDVQIYRPFLIRSGQQEGLSFVNGSMVESVSFSAGGFEACYGDKLASVLDVKYRKPRRQFGGSASASLLGGDVMLEGTNKQKSFSYILGLRHKSSKYLLRSIETKGDYLPSATDLQAYLTYQINPKTEIAFLGSYNENKYLVVPSNRETEFGTVNDALRFTVYFEGQEVDRYQTGTGAFTLTHRVDSFYKIKFIASAYSTLESETFDILGQYFIDQLENDLGSSEFGDVAFNRGIGSFLQHARNSLEAQVYSFEHKGYLSSNTDKFYLQYGVRYQREYIDDRLSEWTYIDSAGFSIPNPFDNQIVLQDVIKSKNTLASDRISGYIQNTTKLGLQQNFKLNYGIRSSYWSLNKDIIFSPRFSASFAPNNFKRLLFKFATGWYYQPPFYREMRRLDGTLNTNLKAQNALHFVLGSEYTFIGLGKEFKLTAEAYYKDLNDMVPYKIDNLRLRYHGNNNSNGYAYGLDLRLNGELLPGAESWLSIGYLQSKEDINNDFYYNYYNKSGTKIIPGYTFDNVATDSVFIEPGLIPRPTDQRLTVSLFFQDYLPRNPSFKVNLSLIYGTGLPFGPPGNDRYKDVFRYPDYRRVDIGFSKVFIDEDVVKKYRYKLFNHLKHCSLSLEVLNLLQVNNTVSYLWVKDVTGRIYAIPNYLTARQLNVRLNIAF